MTYYIIDQCGNKIMEVESDTEGYEMIKGLSDFDKDAEYSLIAVDAA